MSGPAGYPPNQGGGPGHHGYYAGPWPQGPAEPSLLQRIGYRLLWLMIIGLPLLVLFIRFATDTAGWLTVIYMLYGGFLCAFVQLVLGLSARAFRDAWTHGAMGTWAAVLSLVYYACWALLALSLGDAGDQLGVSSWVYRVFGLAVEKVVLPASVVLGAISLLGTLVAIIVEGVVAKRRADRPS